MIHSEILQSHAVHEMSEKILDVHRNVNMSSVSWQTLAFGWLRLVSFLRLFLSLFRFRACPTGQNAMVNVLHFSTFHTDGPLHISSSMMFNVKICYTNLYHGIWSTHGFGKMGYTPTWWASEFYKTGWNIWDFLMRINFRKKKRPPIASDKPW